MPKNRFFLLLLALLLPVSLLLATQPPRGTKKKTTVYIVRHAEKDLTPGLTDPPLTAAGEQRALALRQQLQRRRVAAIFTTDTRRTRATAAPLAEALNLTPQVYDAKNLPALATRIRQEYAGRAVLVVGHSNTLLETAEALGATRPVPTVADAEYDYLLEVKLPATGAATATARRYGVASAQSAVKPVLK
ncbi:Histidine phosphatase superfamily (branch 1) [Hymenobacter daecheongensis DSM 21074]|uniref:Histidine phosphatase superfamily (Branch 1) n=1 Tax=Hymenobacter daecheongensis DSM 21074 TaxID=1121955 RepID=A0A1M6JPL2_9BACT|nr:histidine phosphatase family protein [Hymenobacter daecheongensis]SHJ48543.1 Histidine phosphatase superfamily (branch 1) [Hymenobacter daecheongensis DSM 21074]